jgi:hypothetical protein
VPESFAPGTLAEFAITASLGTDVEAEISGGPSRASRAAALAGAGSS